MSAKIKILPDHLINQIAAGEVVEDAASAIKELVENALDARATRIVVSIAKGGYERLAVVDDGCGMSQDDAILCFERHATSKVRSPEDLMKIKTMGFRGEALAAIASVGKVVLSTALQDAGERGSKVEIAGGRIIATGPCGRSSGTTIEVCSLFYNAPARRKFQQTPSASERLILRLMTAFALGHPHVEWILENEKGPLLYAKRLEEEGIKAVKRRAEEILGEEQLLFEQPLFLEENGYSISGFLAPAHLHRTNRSGQYLFVEGRHVFSPLISRAVREAFSTRIPEERHPSFLLYLEFPSGDVDVNVHPQKKEIRLRDEEFAQHFIQKAVRNNFLHLDSPSLPMPSFSKPVSSVLPWEMHEARDAPIPSPALQMEIPQSRHEIEVIGLYDKFLIVNATSLPSSCPLFATRSQEGMVIVDLSLAKMRVTYEALLAQKSAVQQRLLVPKKIKLSHPESQLMEKRLTDLQRIGLEIQPFGIREFLIEAIPPFWEDIDFEEAIMGSLEEFKLENDIHKRLAVRASSYARFHHGSLFSAKILAEDLLKCEEPYFSPRGKPIMALLDARALDRLFRGSLHV